jgi:hypothetical protein
MKAVLGSGMLGEPCEVVNITDLPHLGSASAAKASGAGGRGLVFGGFVQNCARPGDCILEIGFCFDRLADIWQDETKFETILILLFRVSPSSAGPGAGV